MHQNEGIGAQSAISRLQAPLFAVSKKRYFVSIDAFRAVGLHCALREKRTLLVLLAAQTPRRKKRQRAKYGGAKIPARQAGSMGRQGSAPGVEPSENRSRNFSAISA